MNLNDILNFKIYRTLLNIKHVLTVFDRPIDSCSISITDIAAYALLMLSLQHINMALTAASRVIHAFLNS